MDHCLTPCKHSGQGTGLPIGEVLTPDWIKWGHQKFYPCQSFGFIAQKCLSWFDCKCGVGRHKKKSSLQSCQYNANVTAWHNTPREIILAEAVPMFCFWEQMCETNMWSIIRWTYFFFLRFYIQYIFTHNTLLALSFHLFSLTAELSAELWRIGLALKRNSPKHTHIDTHTRIHTVSVRLAVCGTLQLSTTAHFTRLAWCRAGWQVWAHLANGMQLSIACV